MEMRKLIMTLLMVTGLFGSDIIIKSSDYSVDVTIERIKTIVTKKGLSVFAIVDHQKNAAGVDMRLGASKVIIFGNPRMGTMFMQQDIRAGLDLPLRVLVYEDSDAKVKIAYRDGAWLKRQHDIDAPKLFKGLDGALDKITTKAGKKSK